MSNREIAAEAARLAEAIERAGVPRDRAVAEANRRYGISTTATPAELEEADARAEKEHVRAADKQMRSLGFRIINTSQPRHAKYITPGVPDRIYFHRERGIGLFWEAKAAGGRQSGAQLDFMEDCYACGWPYVLGTEQDLYTWLRDRRIAVQDECGNLITFIDST